MAGWAPLILTVAPNGAYKTQRDHPALPLTPVEVARTAARCREAGAAMIHLHVRDEAGRHCLDADAYRAAIDAIRRSVGDRLVIQATTEAAGRYRAPEQMQLVRELRPESVSIAIRELIPDQRAEPAAAEFLAWVAAERITPQFILYSPDETERLHALRRRGVVPPGLPWVLFVFGRYGAGESSEPRDLLPFLASHDWTCPWGVCAFGAREHACGVAAASLGGHVRVGFENNLTLKDGRIAPDNAALVGQMHEAVSALGRPVADAAAARELLSRTLP